MSDIFKVMYVATVIAATWLGTMALLKWAVSNCSEVVK